MKLVWHWMGKSHPFLWSKLQQARQHAYTAAGLKKIKHRSHLLSGHGAPPSMVEQKAALFGSVVPKLSEKSW